MAGSNDPSTRKQIFDWIAQHEKTFYLPRSPFHPIGVYFSPASRNFDAAKFLPSYRGTLVLLLQNHLEFQVVTSKTLSNFHGETLVLPDVSVLEDSERKQLQDFSARGGKLVIAGADATGFAESPAILRFADSPGSAHLSALEKDFSAASENMPKEFLAALSPSKEVVVSASQFVASNTALVDGRLHIFLMNFEGIIPHHNLKPAMVSSVSITVPATRKCVLHFLPFLGNEQKITAKRAGDSQIFSLPAFDRGAVAWLEDTQ